MIRASTKTLRTLKDTPASFRIAGMMLLRAHRGRIVIELVDGRQIEFDHGEPGPQAEIRIHDYALASRAMSGGDIGFAESYMDAQWSTPDLTEVLKFFSENFEAAGQLAIGGKVVRTINFVRHLFNRNSRSGSKRNIMAHYDLGNDFYALWLDPSMTYSSALFSGPNLSLEQAQKAKYARIADEIGLQPGKSVLEIGCGWGGFAEYAAKERGAKVTCLTISPSQRDYALARIQREGLSEHVEIRLEDYRDHKGSYDGVASIEMFEAVGESYWPSYFDKIAECLKSGARAALQIITIKDELFERYRKRADFIQHYIFPGGMLPSERVLKSHFERANLNFQKAHYFRQDYARTLKQWAETFDRRWPEIEALGFDDRFHRLWRFYLSYCEAGFDNGRINVGQFTLAKA